MSDFKLTPYKVHDDVEIGVQDMYRNPLIRQGMDKSIKEGYTGKGIRIAIIDTGYQEHTDLPNALMVKAFGVKGSIDHNGHGTHVRGIVIQGFPDVEQLIAKAMDAEGNSYSSWDIADAIVWCADQGAHVINMSFGGRNYNKNIAEAIRYADSKNCTIVCSAGNNGKGLTFPASMEEVIAVGAISWNDKLTGFSSRDERLDIVAYGDQIVSAWRDLRNEVSSIMKSLSGTSMSAPWVAVECGRIIQIYMKHYNEIPPNHVTKNILYKAAEILNGIPYGNGKVRGLTTKVFKSIVKTDDSVADHQMNHPELYKKEGFFKRLFNSIKRNFC